MSTQKTLEQALSQIYHAEKSLEIVRRNLKVCTNQEYVLKAKIQDDELNDIFKELKDIEGRFHKLIDYDLLPDLDSQRIMLVQRAERLGLDASVKEVKL